MTRLKKLLVAGLLTLVTCCAALGSAVLNIAQSIFTKQKVSAATDYAYSNKNTTTSVKEGKIIVVDNLASSGKINGTPISIPKTVQVMDIGGTTLSDVNAVVEIKNPYGDFLVNSQGEVLDEQIQAVVNDQGTTETTDDVVVGYTLTPSQVGIYTVQYAYQDTTTGVWTVSGIYKINITAESYTMDFIENDSIVTPSKVDTTADEDVAIALPIFYNEDGTQIKQFVLGNYSDEYAYVAEYVTLQNVWFDENNVPVEVATNASGAQGKNIYETYSTYKITKISTTADAERYNSIDYGLYIEVAIPGVKTATNSKLVEAGVEGPSLKIDETKFTGDTAYYIAAPYKFTATSGKNILTYKLCDKTLSNFQTPSAYSNRTITGSNAYKSTNISIGASVTSNIKPADTSINEKCYLPKVSVVDINENKNAINAYYYYEVKYVVEEDNANSSYDLSADKVVMGIDEKGVYFIPKVKGTYNIAYNARDFYNNTDADYTKYDYDVIVSDRTSPTLKIVNTYDPANNNYGADYSYVIPTKYSFNATKTAQAEDWTVIEIPALYASDNVKSFGELSLKRTISSEKGFVNSQGESVKNFSLDIQSTTGNTDYNVVSEAKNVNVQNVVTFFNPKKTDYEVSQETGGRVARYTNFYIEEQQDGTCVFKNNSGSVLEAEELYIAKASQVAYVVINPNLFTAGTYTVEYSVSDGIYSNNSGSTFKFELVAHDSENLVDTKAPVVNFGSVSVGNVKEAQKISIAKPEIKDDVDSNLLTNYYLLIEDAVVASQTQDIYVPLKLEDNKLTFNMDDKVASAGNKTIFEIAATTANKSFKVIAFAFDDFASIFNPEEDGFDLAEYEEDKTGYENVGVGYYTITLKAADDEVAPYIKERFSDIAIDETAAYDQFSEVNVKGIKFYDNTPNAVVNVKVYDSEGVEYSYQELSGSKVKKLTTPVQVNGVNYNYEYTFAGIKFTANKADNYTINYSVTDDGNNSAAYSFVLTTAKDKEAPTIDGILGTTITKQLGETFYLDTLTSTDNTEGEIEYVIDCVGAEVGNVSSLFNEVTRQFTPTVADTYTVTVKAIDKDSNYSTRSFVVKFTDTTAPKLELIGGSTNTILLDEGSQSDDANVNWAEEKFPEVSLPGFSVTDYNADGTAIIAGGTGSITITTPSNNSYEIDIRGNIQGNNPLNIERRKVGSNYNFFFTPTERGKYTVKYNGEDQAKNAATSQTINVYVGDTEDPVITLKDALAKLLKKGFVVGANDELVIDTKVIIDKTTSKTGESDDVTVSDNFGLKEQKDTENDVVFTKITVEVLDANGSVVSQENNTNDVVSYKFTKQGTYTINFRVNDGVSNSGSFSQNFKVSANPSGSSDTTKILGTVLIVVSIVILAGVVIYFVRGTKMLPKKNKAKKQKSEKSEKND